MEKKKKTITFYDLSSSYLEWLRQGLKDTPEERCVKFFEQRRKFNEIIGIKEDSNAKRQIVITVATWLDQCLGVADFS